MPLHLDSIVENKDDRDELAVRLLQNAVSSSSSLCGGGHAVHLHQNLIDRLSGERIGDAVCTLNVDAANKQLSVLDEDVVWNAAAATRLRFVRPIDASAPGESYEVKLPGTNCRAVVEVVDRHVVSGGLKNTEREVFICAFPFQASLYPNFDAFHAKTGHTDPVSGRRILLHDRFVMPCGLFCGDHTQSGTTLVGTIVYHRKVQICLGSFPLDFILAQSIRLY